MKRKSQKKVSKMDLKLLRHQQKRSKASPPSPTASQDAHAESKQRNETQTISQRLILKFQEVPKWMQDNDFIRSGYRAPTFSYRKCFQSLLYFHNETINIYSHLFGVVLFLCFTIFTLVHFYQTFQLAWWDYLVLLAFLGTAITCLFLSTTFHLFNCHSHKVCLRWNKCDYIGIVLLIVGSFFPFIYHAFYCHQLWKSVYLLKITGFGVVTAILCSSDRFQTLEYRAIRTCLFLAMGLSGILPLFHAISLHGWHFSWHAFSLDNLLLMGTLYIIGAMIYGWRIPERWFPGKFDYWFHSHQIFHMFVLAAAVTHYRGVLQVFWIHHTSDTVCQIPKLL